MRKTKFAFFSVLLLLTAVLIVIIVGESDRFIGSSDLVLENQPKVDLVTSYQESVEKILLSWQQQILQQTMTRSEAVRQIREDLLNLEAVPSNWRDLHWNLVLAMTKDMNGQIAEANQMYEELRTSYQWLRAELEYFLLLSE